MGEEKDKMKQNNVIVSDTDDDDDDVDQTNNEIGRTEVKEKRGRGRPRKKRKSSTIISESDGSGEEVEKDGVPGNTSDITSEMVLTPVVQSKFNFTTNKVINTVKKGKCGTKKAKEASSTNDQEPEQTEDRVLDKTKTKRKEKETYPCAICGKNVGNSSRECKGCDKWVHYRCHVSNKGIAWNDDLEKKD